MPKPDENIFRKRDRVAIIDRSKLWVTLQAIYFFDKYNSFRSFNEFLKTRGHFPYVLAGLTQILAQLFRQHF